MNIKKILHHLCYRGTRECDLILKKFYDEQHDFLLEEFQEKDWQRLDTFLSEPETKILNWLIGREQAPENYCDLIARITSDVYQTVDEDFLKNLVAQNLIKKIQQNQTLFCFYGNLGVGKSTLIREIIRSLYQDPELPVPSPTYTLMQEYTCKINDVEKHLWHMDLYRIQHPLEVEELGLLEILKNDICFLEWPERIKGYIPQKCINIYIKINLDQTRSIRIESEI